jgi:hypothetical protein
MNGVEKVYEPASEEAQDATEAAPEQTGKDHELEPQHGGLFGCMPLPWAPTREMKIEQVALHWLADKVQGRLPQNHEIKIALEGAKYFFDQLALIDKAEEEA